MRPGIPRTKGIRHDKDRDTGRPEEKRDLLPEENQEGYEVLFCLVGMAVLLFPSVERNE